MDFYDFIRNTKPNNPILIDSRTTSNGRKIYLLMKGEICDLKYNQLNGTPFLHGIGLSGLEFPLDKIQAEPNEFMLEYDSKLWIPPLGPEVQRFSYNAGLFGIKEYLHEIGQWVCGYRFGSEKNNKSRLECLVEQIIRV